MKHLTWRRVCAALLLGLALVSTAHAAIDTYEFKTEAERERYRHLTEELRCPKCQNQNIADSNAPIALDLRAEIYKKIEGGESDQQIIDYLVARYGNFVLYKPPVTARTLVLWYGPAALLIGGFVLLAVIVLGKRRRKAERYEGLSTDEQQRLAAVLNQAPLDKKD
ncbi:MULTISPECIES: cytochrome c-type biogenesis protein [Pseudomonas]|uniref:Cytochrome c-type biogenesis protein n=1 Tax=Pseudomonas segetis TaxID=298908 RepID=A0A239JX53_9PSED|nr:MULTISPECIES: cytochrome c-type biogenesis protein [Pseudomonas]SNT10471.1 cytochrome c-type biogenesis protein CcmH [Pseudomonas segetis]